MTGIQKIAIGPSPDEPALLFRSASPRAYAGEEIVDRRSAIWQAMLAMQAIPDLLTGAMLHSSKLMEVSINGDLIQAADGLGFRAFAMGEGGIVEHARLFNPTELSTILNVTNVFKVVSVVVAQKHLADISKLLGNIERGVNDLRFLLRTQQAAKIRSAFDYLKQAQAAVASGDTTPAIRGVLEHIELDMVAVQFSFEEDFRISLDKPIHTGALSRTEEFSSGVQKKLDGLSELLKEHRLATMTRIAALRVLSAFPGEQALKKARASALAETLERYDKMGVGVGDRMTAEIPQWHGTAESLKNTALQIVAGIATGHIEEMVRGKLKPKRVTPERDAAVADAKAQAIRLSSEESATTAKLTKLLHVTEGCLDGRVGLDQYLIDWGQSGPERIWKAQR